MIDENYFYFFYNIIYLCVAYCSLSLLIYQHCYGGVYRKREVAFLSRCIVFFFSFLLVLLVGLREFNVGADTGNYFRIWLYDLNLFTGKSDILFYYVLAFVREFFGSYQLFLLIVSILFYAVNYKYLKRFSRYYEADFLFVFFVFISLFFSLSTSINIIRQGLSLSFLLLGLSFFPENKRFKIIVCFILSVGFHMTAIMPILFLVFIEKFKKIDVKFYIFLFFLGIVLSYFNFSLLDISPILEKVLSGAEDRRGGYLNPQDFGYKVGFRPDFVFFNLIFLMFFLSIRKVVGGYFYDYLIKFYCLSSFLFFMAFQMNFSDRFGLFSWFVIAPLLTPAFNKKYSGISRLFFMLTVFSLYFYFLIIKRL